MLLIGSSAESLNGHINFALARSSPAYPFEKSISWSGFDDENFVLLGDDLHVSPRQKGEMISYFLRNGNLPFGRYFWHRRLLDSVLLYQNCNTGKKRSQHSLEKKQGQIEELGD